MERTDAPGPLPSDDAAMAGEAELTARRAAWRPQPPRHKSGLLAKYAKLVGQANLGAVTHEGGAEWPWFDR